MFLIGPFRRVLKKVSSPSLQNFKYKITEDNLTVLLYFSHMQFYINVHNQWWKAHIFYFK